MGMEVNYGLSFNPSLVESGGYGRFHELSLDKSKQLSNLAANYSADGNFAAAERILLDIDFTNAVNRKSFEAQKQYRNTGVSISNYNQSNRDIEHIHHNCAMKILRDMRPMIEDDLIEMFLRNMKRKYPNKSKEIDFLLCGITGENPVEVCGD